MAIPSEIEDLTTRLNEELEAIDRIANRGLEQVRLLLNRFQHQNTALQLFAYFNNALFFIEISRTIVRAVREKVDLDEVDLTEIQDAGEELSNRLGRAIEIKIEAEGLMQRLEETQ